jgi:galactokinase
VEISERYGEPEFAVRAPGRVNLIGEHTDYNDGYVMPVAIDREIHLYASARHDRVCRLYSDTLRQEALFDLDHLQPDQIEPWARYAAGVAFMLQFHTKRALTGVDAVITSTLPTGSGLSSSAALEAVFAVLWNRMDDLNLDKWILAKLCRQAEHEYAGVHCGIMDQAASLLCQAGHALFLDTRTMQTKHVRLPDDWAIVVADTGKPRTLSGSEYNQRRMECEQAVEILNDSLDKPVHALRDVSAEAFMRFAPGLPAETLRKRASHVIGENERVREFAKALHFRSEKEIGLLMTASHASLRDDYEVSCPELDCMQAACLNAPGCLGARMTGAGFGGACVALVLQKDIEAFIDAAENAYRAQQPYEAAFYACKAVGGASTIDNPVVARTSRL